MGHAAAGRRTVTDLPPTRLAARRAARAVSTAPTRAVPAINYVS